MYIFSPMAPHVNISTRRCKKDKQNKKHNWHWTPRRQDQKYPISTMKKLKKLARDVAISRGNYRMQNKKHA